MPVPKPKKSAIRNITDGLSNMKLAEPNKATSTTTGKQPAAPATTTTAHATKGTARGPYHRYTSLERQELIDLVIKHGLSARQAALQVGVPERTAQYYVQMYREKENKEEEQPQEEHQQQQQDDVVVDPEHQGNDITPTKTKQLQQVHTDFLCDLYDEIADLTLWEARSRLLEAFPDLDFISLSHLQRHLSQHATLTFKRVETPSSINDTDATTLKDEKEELPESVVAGYLDMDWLKNCVFVDNAIFRSYLRRNFGLAAKGQPAKRTEGSDKGILLPVYAAICESGPVSIKTKSYSPGSDFFLEFIAGILDTLDAEDKKGRYLVMQDTAPYNKSEVKALLQSRGYKAAYLRPDAPFVNPVKQFWPKLETGMRRDVLGATDTITVRLKESSGRVTAEEYQQCIQHSVNLLKKYIITKLFCNPTE